MWIVWGYALGNSLSISLQFVDLFQLHLSLMARARLEDATCTLSQAFLWDTLMFKIILLMLWIWKQMYLRFYGLLKIFWLLKNENFLLKNWVVTIPPQLIYWALLSIKKLSSISSSVLTVENIDSWVIKSTFCYERIWVRILFCATTFSLCQFRVSL